MIKQIFNTRKLGVAVVLVLVLLSASPVLAALTFSAIMSVTNTSATTYAQLPVIAVMDNSYLATNGFTNANGTDVQLALNGSALPRMLSQTNTYTSLPVTAGQSYNINYTTNNVPANFAVIFGNGGYADTIDTAALEPGADFSVEMNGYVDTTQVGKPLFVKPGALSLNVDPVTSGTITGTIYSTSDNAFPKVRSQTSGTGNSNSIIVTNPTGTTVGDIILVMVNVEDTGSSSPTLTPPAGWTALFTSTYFAGGVGGAWWAYYTPSLTGYTWGASSASANTFYSWQSLRITGSGVVVAGVVATNPGGVTNPDPPNLVSGLGAVKTMWLACAFSRAPMASAPAGYANLQNTGDGAHSSFVSSAELENSAASENPGTFGTGTSQWATNTLAFKGSMQVSKVVASGVHDIFMTEDGGGLFYIKVDGVNSATLVSHVVTDNANKWYWMYSSLATPYMTYIQETVGGVEKLRYQPQTLVVSTTLVDVDGTQNGVITWGNNPSGITATMSNLSTTPTSINTSADAVNPQVALSPGLNIAGGLGNTGTTLPLGPLISEAVTQYNTVGSDSSTYNPPPVTMTTNLVWMYASWLIVAMFFVGTLIASKSFLLAFIVGGVPLGAACKLLYVDWGFFALYMVLGFFFWFFIIYRPSMAGY